MVKKIDVLLPRQSQYEVIHHFAAKLHEAFQRAGYKTRLLNRAQFEETYKKSPPDLTVGFNGAPRTDEGLMLCDIYKIPHFSFLLDPPYRFSYLVESPLVSIGCDDRVCCRLLQESGFERTFLFPHAVEPELTPDLNSEKIYDVVMLATFIDFEQIRKEWPAKYDKTIVDALSASADETFTNLNKSFITAFQESYQGYFDWKELSEPLQELELYVKGKDRVLLAQSIKSATVHIFGGSFGAKGWKDYLGKKHPTIYVHNPVSYEEAIEIMKQSKIVLNPSLKNKEGAHERLFTGIACGAYVVTADSHFVRETMVEGNGLTYYDHKNLDSLDLLIHQLLNDEDKRIKRVQAGHQIILNHHTWDHRISSLKI